MFKCENVHKSYGNKKVLRGISFELDAGDIVGIAGDNGCGKSTLLSILAGVERPNKGAVTIDGVSIYRLPSLRAKVGYVPQTDPLPSDMRVGECLSLWCRSRGDMERVGEEYELTDILRQRISKLSGGMRRRVSIACAAASVPDIMILDEPTSSLDMHFTEIVRDDMLRLSEAGTGIILVSHNRAELDMCNTCFYIKNGINERL